jgi:hypothetical protein
MYIIMLINYKFFFFYLAKQFLALTLHTVRGSQNQIVILSSQI